mmetsp:Transcript_27486/g.60114  ORF Transcript_27486/g.60114 Transcript_27486/m.60114 type:complete len:217 (-) Transcript_27486:1602-2252(-)
MLFPIPGPGIPGMPPSLAAGPLPAADRSVHDDLFSVAALAASARTNTFFRLSGRSFSSLALATSTVCSLSTNLSVSSTISNCISSSITSSMVMMPIGSPGMAIWGIGTMSSTSSSDDDEVEEEPPELWRLRTAEPGRLPGASPSPLGQADGLKKLLREEMALLLLLTFECVLMLHGTSMDLRASGWNAPTGKVMEWEWNGEDMTGGTAMRTSLWWW